MAIETVRTARTSFDLKSASLPVVAVVLKTTDTAVLTAELALRMAEAPGFFDNDPVLIDLGSVREEDNSVNRIDFLALMDLLRSHHTVPVAVRGGNEAQMQAAFAAGLIAAPEVTPPRAERAAAAQPLASADPVEHSDHAGQAGQTDHADHTDHAAHADHAAQAATDPVHAEMSAPPVVIPGAMVIDKPLRSGQQVYARGTDLVVLAMVSFGAEVIADGNIHVYAPLRGRAIAGARGNINARIFSTCMEPQLVSIAGIYRTTEVAISADVLGKSAQVRLDGEKLLIERL